MLEQVIRAYFKDLMPRAHREVPAFARRHVKFIARVLAEARRVNALWKGLTRAIYEVVLDVERGQVLEFTERIIDK